MTTRSQHTLASMIVVLFMSTFAVDCHATSFDGGPASYLVDGALVAAPSAFTDMCALHVDQCSRRGSGTIVHLDEANRKILSETNVRVNRHIRPKSVPDAAEEWSPSATEGDCNDYAVQKRMALLDAGLPSSAISLTMARTPKGNGHLILTVRTDEGDVVLDNLRDDVVSVADDDYEWIARQSTIHPRIWVELKRPQVAGLALDLDQLRGSVEPVEE